MPYKITLIGSGNMAWNLGHALHQHGQIIQQVISKTPEHARELALKLKAKSTHLLSELDQTSDIILICVKDEAIEQVASQINVNRQVVAHCSGSIPIEVLTKTSFCYGVFYPLQTLTRNALKDFKDVPVCVEGCNNEAEEILFTLADSISNQVHRISSTQRLHLHLAAVIANNFTNSLYGIAKEILDRHHLSFDLLKPLITETARNVQQYDPRQMQTGPAKRHDETVIQKHLELLAGNPEWQQLYNLLSNLIKKQY
ncbi:MAG: DUF2520 domain-containing protein [Bacteroidia bacterium]|nr:DUF2520 domain-containing protein [Bacteroidia bacterium]